MAFIGKLIKDIFIGEAHITALSQGRTFQTVTLTYHNIMMYSIGLCGLQGFF